MQEGTYIACCAVSVGAAPHVRELAAGHRLPALPQADIARLLRLGAIAPAPAPVESAPLEAPNPAARRGGKK